jgi:site-specific DNA recombinase
MIDRAINRSGKRSGKTASAAIGDGLLHRDGHLADRIGNGHTGGRAVRNKYGALLKGLIRCRTCRCAMSHTYTAKGNKRYRYYVCGTAQQRGWSECPAPSIPAGEIERFVVDQIRAIGRDPDLLRETLQQVHQQVEALQRTLSAEQTLLQRQVRSDHDVLQAVSTLADAIERVSVLATVQERLRVAERRLSEIDSELARLDQNTISDDEVSRSLADFDQVWQTLAPREQARILELLIDRVAYDGERGQVALTFRPCGIRSLTHELKESA